MIEYVVIRKRKRRRSSLAVLALVFLVALSLLNCGGSKPIGPTPITREDIRGLIDRVAALDSTIHIQRVERDSLRGLFFRDLAITVAKRDGRYPWRILYGLWMRESRMDPKAKGDGVTDTSGNFWYTAFGLGQVHLSTAKAECGTEVTKEDLLDPVKGGFKSGQILGNYIDKFGGDLRYGISAYQQGPGATREQYASRSIPRNIRYVADVLTFAASTD